jgi:hypothetical protein
VEDNGPGIDAVDLPLIFEKFYRGKRGAHKGKGSGMGLAITRAILIAHGGGIEAASVAGKGASFHFWVPLVEKEPARERATGLPSLQASAARATPKRRKKIAARHDDMSPESGNSA